MKATEKMCPLLAMASMTVRTQMCGKEGTPLCIGDKCAWFRTEAMVNMDTGEQLGSEEGCSIWWLAAWGKNMHAAMQHSLMLKMEGVEAPSVLVPKMPFREA